MISVYADNLKSAEAINTGSSNSVIIRFGAFCRLTLDMPSYQEAMAVADAINRTIPQTPTKRI